MGWEEEWESGLLAPCLTYKPIKKRQELFSTDDLLAYLLRSVQEHLGKVYECPIGLRSPCPSVVPWDRPLTTSPLDFNYVWKGFSPDALRLVSLRSRVPRIWVGIGIAFTRERNEPERRRDCNTACFETQSKTYSSLHCSAALVSVLGSQKHSLPLPNMYVEVSETCLTHWHLSENRQFVSGNPRSRIELGPSLSHKIPSPNHRRETYSFFSRKMQLRPFRLRKALLKLDSELDQQRMAVLEPHIREKPGNITP
jgi:hypothetical protein